MRISTSNNNNYLLYILFQSTNSIQNNIRTFLKLLDNKFLTAENYNIPLKISE